MENDLSEKILKLLSDPTAAAKISAVASSLGATDVKPQEPVQQAFSPAAPVTQLLSGFGNKNRNTELLCAVKPFLREEKQGKIEALLRAMSIAELISGLKKGGGI